MGLDVTGLGAVFDFGSKVLERIFPDPTERLKAQTALTQLKESGELAKLTAETDLAKLQAQTNIEEAKSTNWWVAGWRPGIGWICGVILALTYIPKAIALTAFWCVQVYLTFSHPDAKLPGLPTFPDLGVTDVLGLLGTLLGSAYLAKLRTDEKKAGAEGNR